MSCVWPVCLHCSFKTPLVQPCFAPPPCLTGFLLLLFFLLYALPSCPWVCMALWQAWHISLDCDALWQKINTPPLVWYGDKTVIILMLCLCGLSFCLIIAVSDVLHWYHCCCTERNCSLCVQTECVWSEKNIKFLTNSIDFSVNTEQPVCFFNIRPLDTI